MSDEQFLLLIFGLLYFAECLEWLPRWYVGFGTATDRSWRLRRPSREFGNDSAGLLLKFPLPPLGTFVASQPLPLLATDSGILVCALHSPNPGCLPRTPESHATWQELRKVRRDGKQLMIGGRTFLKAHSEREAIRLATLLDLLVEAPSEHRETILRRHLRNTFAVASVRRRLAAFRLASRRLRILCNSLFAVLFVGIPPVVWRWGFEHTWLSLLVVLLGLMILCALEFRSLHRRTFRRGKGERWINVALACVAPHHAVRLRDVAARGLLADFHPLACARVLLDSADFPGFASRWYRDLKFPVPDDTSSFAREKAAMRAWWIAETLAFLERFGLGEETLLERPPVAEEVANGSFCPRCHSTYELAAASCEDCGGLTTRPMRSKVEGGG